MTTKTMARPSLDELLLSAPDDRAIVLRRYSIEMLRAKKIDDLANERFATTVRTLGKSASVVRADFTRVQGFRKAQRAFDPAELQRAKAKELEALKAHAAYVLGGRFARSLGLADHDELQPEASLRLVELDAQRRDSTTPEERAAIFEEVAAVKAQSARLAHRAKAAEGVVEELLRKKDRITMLSEGDLFMALPTESKE